MLSSEWSDAPGRAIVEADRALLYALVVALFASMRREPGDLRWMLRGVAVALLFVCVVGLVTRLLPDTFSGDLGITPGRLSHPVTYWNALGVMAVMGALLFLHFSADAAEPLAVRALSAGAVPILAVTALFTFSRGAIVVGALGIVLYLVLTLGAGQLAALLAIAVPTAVALVSAYGAEALASTDPTQPLAVEQGKDVALVLVVAVVNAIVIRAALGVAAPRITRLVARRTTERVAVRAAWGLGALAAVVALLAAGAPQRASDAVDTFFHGQAKPAATTDLRARLGAAESSGRVEQWDVALDGFAEEPLRGHGAGMFEALWNEDRSQVERMIDAHGLYQEVLAELGLVGALLVVVALVAMLAGFALRMRGRDRALGAALVAVGVVWCAHAGADWDWETPSTGIWLFALGGLAAARARLPGEEVERPSGRWTVVAALCLIAVAVAPLVVMLSERRVATAEAALVAGDCDTAADEALSSIDALNTRREPFEILGFCRAQAGFPRQGRDAMLKAVERDPANWEARYGLALVRAQAGEDPRPDLAAARRMSPLEPLVVSTQERIAEAARSEWPQIAVEEQRAAIESSRLTVADQ
jgi:O-antigen ligase